MTITPETKVHRRKWTFENSGYSHKKYLNRPCYIAGLEFDRKTKELYGQWEKSDGGEDWFSD